MSAHVITIDSKYDHITPVDSKTALARSKQRIQLKDLLAICKAISGKAPVICMICQGSYTVHSVINKYTSVST